MCAFCIAPTLIERGKPKQAWSEFYRDCVASPVAWAHAGRFTCRSSVSVRHRIVFSRGIRMPARLRKAKPRAPRVLVRQLTIFLLGEKITTIDEALDLDKLGALDAYEMASLNGKLFVGPSPGKEPKWVGFVKEGVKRKLPTLLNRTISAALIFKVKKRLCAVTFGFGRYFLKPDAFEFDFGLKATLNTVDPSKLRSMDTRTF